MAGGANLAVDLESSAEGGTIVGRHETEMIPVVGGGVEDFVVTFG